MASIHNHYVPAYYLRGFTDPATGKLYMYVKPDIKVVCTSPASVANELHYWSDETERYLANEVEGPANPLLDKIRNLQPLDANEKYLLARYIVTMIKRVPKGRDRVLARAPEVIKETMVKYRTLLEAEAAKNPKVQPRVQEFLRETDNLPNEFFERQPEEMWEGIISPEKTRQTVEVLSAMTWVFLVAGGKHGFVTSDNPVVYTVANGIRPPAGQLLFPISQNVVLFANWNFGTTKEYPVADPSLVDEINNWIVRSASDYIFYSGHKNWIRALIKRESKRTQSMTSKGAS